MTPIRLSLPWPPSTLSPNKRQHWARLAKAKAAYRDACRLSVLAQRIKAPTAPRLRVLLEFVPPDRRRYDRDNLIARMKAGLDGLASAWDIDDAAFVFVGGEIANTMPAKVAAEVRVTISQHFRSVTIERDADGLPQSIGLGP